MAQRFDEAWKKVASFAGAPCLIEVPDEELWGLQGGVAQAIVFHWPSVAAIPRENFLKAVFGQKLAPHLAQGEEGVDLANKDLVPFALIGRPGLHEEGATLEAYVHSHLAGVLFFDLVHGTGKGACPILLFDLARFGKVASDVAALKLRLAAGGTVSHAVQLMPPRVFVLKGRDEVRYWEIEVHGRRVKMQRGKFSPQGQKDWATNEVKEGDFPTSVEAKARAEQLVLKYLRDGYVEQVSLDAL